jgi:biotin carboxylase
MSYDRILLIGVGTMGRPYLDELTARGTRVRVVEREPRAAALRDEGIDVVTSPGAAEEQFVAAALSACATFNPTAAIPFAEPHVLASAWVQKRFGLRGPGFEASMASRDKAIQRTLLKQEGVRQPEFVLTTEVTVALDFHKCHGPVIVKGLRGSGSHCVRLAATETEITNALPELSRTEPALVEEFIIGREYSAELLVKDTVIYFSNVTSKITSGPPEFVELGHTAPAEVEGISGLDTDRFFQDVVRGLGIQTSFVHLEFLVRDGLLYLVEVALRTPGDHIMELIREAYGFSPYGAVIDLYASGKIAVNSHASGVAGVRYLQPSPGFITQLGDISELAGNSSVRRFEYPYSLGDYIAPLRSSRDRSSYVIFVADTRDVIERNWRNIANALEPLTAQEDGSQSPGT